MAIPRKLTHSLDWFLPAIGLLTLVGAGLRFSGLGARDFWFDESCTFRYVQNLFDWPEDSNLLVESTNLPYYLALRGWVALFGSSEACYRSLSALAAMLTIPLLGLVARRLAGRLAGVVCALLVAFHPLHIYYAHEARAYALWVLCLVGAMFLLVEAVRRQRWTWWAMYGLCTLLCLHLHYFTLYWVPATMACVYLAENRRKVGMQWVVTTAAVALGFLPYFLTAVWPASRQGGGAWIAPTWEPATALLKTLWAFLPAGGYPKHLRGLSILSTDTVVLGPAWLTAVTRTVPAIVVAVVVLSLVTNALRRRDAERWRRDGNGATHVFLAFLTLGPLALAYLYSLLIRPNYLVGRYDLVAWPGFMIWLALAISSFARTARRVNPRVVTTMVCLPMVACALLPIGRMASLRPPTTFHHARAIRLAQLCGPGDLVIAFSYDRDYLSYYLHQAGFAGRIVSFPSWLDRQVGWVDTDADLAPERRAALLQDAQERIALVQSVMNTGGRVFVLVDFVARVSGDARNAIVAVFKNAVEHAGLQSHSIDHELMILELTATESSSP